MVGGVDECQPGQLVCNGPLEPSTEYTVGYRLQTGDQFVDYQFENATFGTAGTHTFTHLYTQHVCLHNYTLSLTFSLSLSPSLSRTHTHTLSLSAAAPSNIGIIVGAVAGVLLVIVVIVTVVIVLIIVFMRNKHNSGKFEM